MAPAVVVTPVTRGTRASLSVLRPVTRVPRCTVTPTAAAAVAIAASSTGLRAVTVAAVYTEISISPCPEFGEPELVDGVPESKLRLAATSSSSDSC
ncbi:hypothetical protein ABZ814_11175 [Micromonospora musae]|uniref:hypothetical protein n=1 Tax=Micromonospora musae TaxID=1894970 RepID=UPI0033FEF17E